MNRLLRPIGATRRGFLKRTAAAAAAAPWIVPASALGRSGDLSPSERVVMGAIGLGHGTGEQQPYVAVCDVQKQRLEAGVNWNGGPAKCTGYSDFRDLLARQDIDAVRIATPHHWHVPISIAAIKAGKDVFCEKPLGITIAEGRALRDAVRRHRAVFEHGTESRANPRNGYLGEVRSVHVMCPAGHNGAGGPTSPAPVPPGLDYDLWLGPSPWAPYTAGKHGSGYWYFNSDFEPSGWISAWGVHVVDIMQWALGMDDTGPVEIEGSGQVGQWPRDTPYDWDLTYTYANGVRVRYTPGHVAESRPGGEGIIFEGSQGWLCISYYGRLVKDGKAAEPESLLTARLGPNDVRLPVADSFRNCVRKRQRPVAHAEAAHRSTSFCQLGAICVRLGRRLKWDPLKEEFPGDPEANRLLGRAMREPWGL
jgi:predicted dehydrogenase